MCHLGSLISAKAITDYCSKLSSGEAKRLGSLSLAYMPSSTARGRSWRILATSEGLGRRRAGAPEGPPLRRHGGMAGAGEALSEAQPRAKEHNDATAEAVLSRGAGTRQAGGAHTGACPGRGPRALGWEALPTGKGMVGEGVYCTHSSGCGLPARHGGRSASPRARRASPVHAGGT